MFYQNLDTCLFEDPVSFAYYFLKFYYHQFQGKLPKSLAFLHAKNVVLSTKWHNSVGLLRQNKSFKQMLKRRGPKAGPLVNSSHNIEFSLIFALYHSLLK